MAGKSDFALRNCALSSSTKMADIQTLGILEEIGALVSDHLQLVSYKWLSRKFLVSSNAAKKLLQEFVEKQEDELEVVYSVAGWLKKTPPTYHIRLVPRPKLSEAQNDFDGNCSVQVYSVQACIPKDPAAIWNAEFIQAEELFKQPAAVDNCLRDNRFCGVSNSFVKRNAEGVPLASAGMQSKGAGTSGQPSGSSADQTGSVLQPQQKNVHQPIKKSGHQSSNVTSVRVETDRSVSRDLQKEIDKDKVPLPPTKKKGQSEKSPAGPGGALSNFWGRASSKSKSSNSSVEAKSAAQSTDGVPDSADAQICARENLEAVSSDDEPEVNFKRASNGDGGKKRRVVLDDSDEDDYDNAVNLGSPDPPAGKPYQDSKQKNCTLDIEKKTLNFGEQDESKPAVKKEKATNPDNNHPFKEDFSALNKSKNAKIATSEEISEKNAGVGTSNKNKAADTGPVSPKRRKVMKTRIDERGREVTEVVWEGEEADVEDKNTEKNTSNNVKSSNGHTVKVENNAATNPVSRAPSTKKSPAAGSTVPSHAAGKTGSKKGANAKDPKQGNIMSFFKKV